VYCAFFATKRAPRSVTCRLIDTNHTMVATFKVQCSPANPAQAGEEAVGLSDLSGLPSSFCVLVGE